MPNDFQHSSGGPGRKVSLEPGLYLVATPIGNARDITLRALDVLSSADHLAAEDTRTARHLMEIHGVALNDRMVLAYHDHNGPRQRPRILAALAEGKSVAYVSDAGTPLVADPGFQLARAAISEGFDVHAVPGASAALAALTLAGLPSDRFLFAGFPPGQSGARKRWLAELSAVPATLILFESPKRIHRLLGELHESWGGDRQVAICRELTKRFEQVLRAPLAEIAELAADMPLKGEIVLVIDRAPAAQASGEDLDAALVEALAQMPVKAASQAVADQLGLPRRTVYQRALALKDEA